MRLKLHGLDKQIRYEAAARAMDPGEHVLDVGGGLGDFLEFCGSPGVVADLPVDRSLMRTAARARPFVAVRGALPFRDRSFPTCVSLDTLEHLPPAEREKFVRELMRVADRQVVLTFPTTQYFLPLLVAIARFYQVAGLGSVMIHSLEEHERNGLPVPEEIRRVVDPEHWVIDEQRVFGVGGTLLWILQLVLPFLATAPFNRAMSRLLRPKTAQGGGEVVLVIERKRQDAVA